LAVVSSFLCPGDTFSADSVSRLSNSRPPPRFGAKSLCEPAGRSQRNAVAAAWTSVMRLSPARSNTLEAEDVLWGSQCASAVFCFPNPRFQEASKQETFGLRISLEPARGMLHVTVCERKVRYLVVWDVSVLRAVVGSEVSNNASPCECAEKSSSLIAEWFPASRASLPGPGRSQVFESAKRQLS